MGATRARCHAWRRRTLPIHDSQAHLPQPLPFAARVRCAALARRAGWRAQHGAAPRAVLLWLLLGAVCRAGGGGRDERRLDAAFDAGRLRREAAAAWPPL